MNELINQDTSELVAFSLTRASQQAKLHQDRLDRDGSLGLTDVIGFILDENDAILLGVTRRNGWQLGPDEIAQLLHSAAVSGLTGPGVSLEPDTEQTFKAVYFGGESISRNWVGSVSYAMDFACKEAALGVRPIGVANFPTYADRTVAQMESSREEWNVLSRFWFVPSWLPMLHTKGVDLWLLKRVQVGVMVENLSAEIGGKRQTNYVDKPAQEFSIDLMRRFSEVAERAENREFADGRALMGSLQVAAILLQHARPELVDYWAKNGYRPLPKDAPRSAPALRRSFATARGHVEVHGGVRAAGLAIRLAHNDLGALREAIMKARPTEPRVYAWRVGFNDNLLSGMDDLSSVQKEAASHFVQGSRLREARRFSEAAHHFEAVAKLDPEALVAQFLSAVCHRESLVASAQVNQLESLIAKLSALSAAFPNVPEIQYELAVSLRVVGRDVDAIPLLQRLVNQLPGYTAALHALGMSHYRLGHRREAQKYLSEFIQNADRSRWSDEARGILDELASSESERPAQVVDYEAGTFCCQRRSTWKVLNSASARGLLSGTPAAEHIEVAFVSPRNPDCNIIISVTPFPSPKLTHEQVEQILPRVESTHQRLAQDYHRIEAGPIDLHGVVGVRFILTKRRLGTVFKQSITTLVNRSTAITVTCTAPEPDFENMRQEAFNLMDDLRFLPFEPSTTQPE